MVTTYTKAVFSSRVYNFTRAVIRHRRLLITEKKSTINIMKALRIIEHLTSNLNKNFSDKAAAKFFLNNADDIRYLIKQNDVVKFNQFNELIMKSKSYKYL